MAENKRKDIVIEERIFFLLVIVIVFPLKECLSNESSAHTRGAIYSVIVHVLKIL